MVKPNWDATNELVSEREDERMEGNTNAIFTDMALRDEYIENQRILTLPASKVEPDPTQPRKTFDEDEIKNLAESMDAEGQSSPVKIYFSETNNRFELLYGENRYRAKRDYCTDKELSCIIVEEPGRAEKYNIRVDENLRRQQFTLEELVQITLHYQEEFEAEGRPDVNNAIAERMKVKPGEVSRRLTVAKAMAAEDKVIGHDFAEVVNGQKIENMTTLYYIAAALLTDSTPKRLERVRDLVAKALFEESGAVTRAEAELVNKIVRGKSKATQGWKPKYLGRKDSENETGKDTVDSSDGDDAGVAKNESTETGDNEIAKTGSNEAVEQQGNGEQSPPARKVRRLKSLSVEPSDESGFIKITANTGLITREQAGEFARALLAVAEQE